MSSFGQIITGEDVESAAGAILALWLPTYVHEVERQTSRVVGSLPALRPYPVLSELFKPNGYQGPGYGIISTGLAGSPVKDGNGCFRAVWMLTVGVIVQAKDYASTNRNIKAYAAAVRAAILQHPGLGTFAVGTEWEDESYDQIPADRSRTFAVAEVVFRIEVENTIDQFGAPLHPDEVAGPVGDWPVAVVVNVNVNPVDEVV